MIMTVIIMIITKNMVFIIIMLSNQSEAMFKEISLHLNFTNRLFLIS